MSAHVLLAWEFAEDLEDETARTLRLCVTTGSRVTVALVAVPQRVLAYGMPFCGVALIEQVQEGLVRAAQRLACRTACSAPDGVCADHLVVTAWSDLVRLARDRAYDSVLVVGPPTRLGDRVLVRRAGWPSAQAAVGVSPKVSEVPKVSTNASSSTGLRRSFVGKPRSG